MFGPSCSFHKNCSIKTGCCVSITPISLDWLKGKPTGNPCHCWHKTLKTYVTNIVSFKFCLQPIHWLFFGTDLVFETCPRKPALECSSQGRWWRRMAGRSRGQVHGFDAKHSDPATRRKGAKLTRKTSNIHGISQNWEMMRDSFRFISGSNLAEKMVRNNQHDDPRRVWRGFVPAALCSAIVDFFLMNCLVCGWDVWHEVVPGRSRTGPPSWPVKIRFLCGDPAVSKHGWWEKWGNQCKSSINGGLSSHVNLIF